ncbi:hypothetical protein [Duganella sp. HH101]|uniref:hypothetical protein n=1 Tax=Duganella sp. HH101 TaxID=1781066 RepID=UPI0008737646|nr:hypothetical protein [Duganella sp. HH101]OFA00337.1 hypothetical protein DUGA2_48780 [Duganella sp. HH101]
MKIFDKEIPSDLEIPELDEKTKAEIDALDAEWERDKEVMNQIHERYKERWPTMQKEANLPPPTINVEAFRKLSPRIRAIFAYIHREAITY